LFFHLSDFSVSLGQDLVSHIKLVLQLGTDYFGLVYIEQLLARLVYLFSVASDSFTIGLLVVLLFVGFIFNACRFEYL